MDGAPVNIHQYFDTVQSRVSVVQKNTSVAERVFPPVLVHPRDAQDEAGTLYSQFATQKSAGHTLVFPKHSDQHDDQHSQEEREHQFWLK